MEKLQYDMSTCPRCSVDLEHVQCAGSFEIVGRQGGNVAGGREIYAAACKLGHEGIIAKRRDLPYESGRSKRWLKIKNPDSPAMRRIADGEY